MVSALTFPLSLFDALITPRPPKSGPATKPTPPMVPTSPHVGVTPRIDVASSSLSDTDAKALPTPISATPADAAPAAPVAPIPANPAAARTSGFATRAVCAATVAAPDGIRTFAAVFTAPLRPSKDLFLTEVMSTPSSANVCAFSFWIIDVGNASNPAPIDPPRLRSSSPTSRTILFCSAALSLNAWCVPFGRMPNFSAPCATGLSSERDVMFTALRPCNAPDLYHGKDGSGM